LDALRGIPCVAGTGWSKHGSVGQTLLEANLLDELKLWIHPVVVGSGTQWFREGKKSELELVSTATTATGVVIVTYRRPGA